MKKDHEEAAASKEEKDEPETRVKKTVKDVIGQKFREVLRKSQQIQTESKNEVSKKIKRQLKNALKDAPDEEIERLSRNPEEAQSLISS